MPKVAEREYRAMSLLVPTTEKRIESDYYVEGLAAIFDKPYELYEFDGIKYMEVIERTAFNGADLSDVIMQFDHTGRVLARTKMGGSKPPTLLVEPQERGLFVAADLSQSEASRGMYGDITTGLVHQMSWSWRTAEDYYDRSTHTRYVKRVKKMYDVSGVSFPANSETEISARSWLDGVIEAENREAAARLALAKARHNFYFGGN